jgi:outer membrane protein insertion porin family
MNFKNALRLSIIFLIFTSIINAKHIDYKKPVYKIKITGLKNIKNTKNFMNKLSTQIDRKITDRDLTKVISSLYLLGYFKKVEAFTTPTQNGVILNFSVKENPIIKNIYITGNSIFSDNHLTSLMKNKKETILNINLLEKDKETLTQLYLSKGYELFKIDKIELDRKNNFFLRVNE